MRRFATFLAVIALGFVVEMGTSCKKETAAPSSSNSTVSNPSTKLNQQDSTSTMGSSPYNNDNGHGCGNSSSSGSGGYGY